jgi:hypothetical protein
VDPETLQWEVDTKYFESAIWQDSPLAVLLTTKQAGTTLLKVTARTRSGARVRDEAQVVID